MKKRLLAILLSLMMVVAMLPSAAMATDGSETGGNQADIYPAAGEAFTVALTGSGAADVTISGYMDEDDWYVMDCLVLMYDGIYNAGMNEHNDNATEWTQLVPGVGGNLSINKQTWTCKGLTVSETNVNQVSLCEDIVTGEAGMTYEQVFSASNLSDAMGSGGTYFAPFYTLASFGSIRRDGPILNYVNNVQNVSSTNSVLYIRPQMVSDELITATLTSDGSTTRHAYRDGSLTSSDTKDWNVEEGDYYTFSSISIQANSVKPAEGEKYFYLNKTLYGLRLYDRELTAEEIAQNAAVDKARFEDGTYEAPGTVKAGSGDEIALTEYDFTAKATQTTVKDVNFSSDSAELTLTLNKEGTYRLAFKVGNETQYQDVTVISQSDASAADDAINKIVALPNSGITVSNREAIAEAQAAYNALSDDAKARVGTEWKAKLDACLAALDTAMQGQEISVTFALNGGQWAGEEQENTVLHYGQSGEQLPIPNRALYNFDGWFAGDSRITDADGITNSEWNYLSATELTAHWTAASQSGEGYTITSAEQIYALARILADRPDDDIDEDLKSDYELFGITSGYAAGYDKLQTASYMLSNDISLTDKNGTYYGIPNFAGKFDGGNHTITLNITLPSEIGSSLSTIGGLIASFDGGTVKNLILDGWMRTPEGGTLATGNLKDIGVLAGGYVNNGTAIIENVISHVTMDLQIKTVSNANVYAGAIIGRIYASADHASSITNCVNTGNLTAQFTGTEYSGGCRLGGMVGHAYTNTKVINCRNEGNISTAGSNIRTNAGGLAGTASNTVYTNCVQAGNITSNGYRVYAFPSMGDGSTGNTLLLSVTGTAGQVVSYGSESHTLTGTAPVTFSIPVEYDNGVVENNGFSYNEYLTVNGTRLDWYDTTSTVLTTTLRTDSALNLDTPFQSWDEAIVLTEESHLLALQKAINEGDNGSINTLYALGGLSNPTNYDEARLILQTAYYKLGNDITVDDVDFSGIGNGSYPFGGHLDGQNHTVSLTINLTGTSDGYVGLFGNIDVVGGSEAILRNLNVESTINVTTSAAMAYVGGLAGRVNYRALRLENVSVTANGITATGSSTSSSASLQVGGLFGSGSVPEDSTVSLTVSGAISGTGSKGSAYAGGAMGNGSVLSPITVTFEDRAAVTAENTDGGTSAGGLIGYFASGSVDLRGSKLVNSASSAVSIKSEASGLAYAGGWVGQTASATAAADDWLYVDGSTVVTGDFSVTAKSTSSITYAGGIAGRVAMSFSVLVMDYTNTLPVTGRYVGGLFGEFAAGKALALYNSGNEADISGESSYAGGLIALASSGTITIENCWNTGNVSTTGAYVGGLVGNAGSSSLAIQNSLNTGAVSSTYGGTSYVGGLVGLVGANAGDLTLTNSANGGTLSGTNRGGLIGSKNEAARATYTNALYITTSGSDKAVGVGTAPESGTIAMNASALSESANAGDSIQLLSAAAPAVLTVKDGNAEFSGQNLYFTAAGSELTFLWCGRELYSATVNVAIKNLTTGDVVITGVNSVYASEADAEAAMDGIQVYYNGRTLVNGTDYDVTHASGKFTVVLKGHYSGTIEKPYTVKETAAFEVTSAGYSAPYDGQPHGITVNAPTGATVEYSSDVTSYNSAAIQYKDAGTYVVYFKVTQGDNEVTGSQVIPISKATITVTAEDKSVTVGGMMPTLTYSEQGRLSGDDWIVEPAVYCSANLNAAGTYDITVYGGDAGGNYVIQYQTGTLTASEKSEPEQPPVPPDDDDNDDDYRPPVGAITYPVNVDAASHGDVTTNVSRAEAGQIVTITVTPDSGYELDSLTVTDADGDELDVTRLSDTRYSFTMPRGRVTVTAEFVRTVSGLPFTDVNRGDWFYDYVAYVYTNGLMDGVGDGLFNPDGGMTRAMVWTILARIDGEVVTGENWIETARAWAMAEGVSDGTNATGLVTREQFATMLWRYAGEPAATGNGISAFTDAADVSDWAIGGLNWALEEGIVTGMGDGILAPQGTATRAQAAAMLMRFIENIG